MNFFLAVLRKNYFILITLSNILGLFNTTTPIEFSCLSPMKYTELTSYSNWCNEYDWDLRQENLILTVNELPNLEELKMRRRIISIIGFGSAILVIWLYFKGYPPADDLGNSAGSLMSSFYDTASMVSSFSSWYQDVPYVD